MDYRYVCIVLCSVLCTALCDTQKMDQIQVQKTIENASALPESTTFHRKARGMNVIYAQMISCAMTYDTVCFLDAAEDYLEVTKNDLLAQADQDALRATGRADPDNTPSHITKVIAKMLKELTGLWNNGLSSFFMGGREAGDEDEEEDEEEESSAVAKSDQNGSSRDSNGEMRKKKKEKKPLKKLIALIKVAVIIGIVFMKVTLLLKLFQAALQFKFFLVTAGGFLINILKVWMEIREKKNNHHHQEEIVYKNPYGGGDDIHGGPGSFGEYNARSYQAQDMAYAQQRPTSRR